MVKYLDMDIIKMHPEELLWGFYNKISKQSKIAFLATFIMGMITHMYMFVNKFPNGDDVASVYHNFHMITSGRWFDNLAMALSSYYSMPWVTGLVAIFFLSLSVVLLCQILELKRSSSIVLTAGLMATFPALASYFSYMFYSDLYMIAQFLGLLAIWLTRRFSWGWLFGILPIACCLGSYQAFIGIPVVVCLLSLIGDILANQKSGRQVLLLLLKYLAVGLLGVLAYVFILNNLLEFLNLELVDYQGIDQMGSITLEQIKKSIPKAFKGFWEYYYQGIYFSSPYYIKLVYLLLWVVSGLALGLALLRRGSIKKPIALLLIPLFALIPLAYNLVYFMAPKAYMHSLMQPQYALMFVMPLFFMEIAEKAGQPKKESKWLTKKLPIWLCSWVLLIGTSLVIYNSFLTVNICYLSLDLKYEITYATQLRILDRIEQHPDYTRQTPVLFLGYFPNEDQSLYPLNTQGFVKNMVGVNGNLVHHYHNYKGFYSNYLGVELVFANDDEAKLIKSKVKERNMPIWPVAGSVDLIDGIMVVHINQENQDAIKIW